MTLQNQNGVLEDICAEIGYTATTTLVDWFGGGSLYIPENPDQDHVIRRVIGERPFARLVAVYGKQVIDIPLDYRRERTRRDRLIAHLITKGFSVSEIARLTILSDRQVKNIRVELEAAGMIPFVLRGVPLPNGADSTPAPLGAVPGGAPGTGTG